MLAKTSEQMSPTLRDVPAEAEVISHQLLVKSGLIRKAAAGVYTYLPLGYRVIRKIEEIVRQEMNRAGGQEIMMPIIQPAELWQKSGRWDVYGDEMFRLKDRHLRDFCLGPTHEEIITTLVQNEIRSYKELPLLLYQIQNKYRDEIRPRFGLLRCREFIMKDLYSFDRDEEGMRLSYRKMYDAYTRIFQRVGIVYKAVEADSGAIGGNTSHEFMALADSGEASIAYCEKCDYVANVEKAEALKKDLNDLEIEAERSRELVHTPGAKTIQALADFLKVDAQKLLKTLFYTADKNIVAVLLRGDRELNEIKLKNFLSCNDLHLASPEEIKEQLGAVIGYVGPIGLEGKARILADNEVKTMKNFVIGANREDYHYINVNLEEDFTVEDFLDLREVEKGDPCPRCGAPLQLARGIEVGQVFQLGTKYSKALSATYTDLDGQEKHFLMGCYGIGVSRTMSAVIEQFHDDQGIIWPISIAPYHVMVIPVSSKDQEQMQLAAKLAAELDAEGIETMLDDRDERAGVKFTDADLIGCPLRITIGKKTVNEGTVDIKYRNSGKELTIKLESATKELKKIISELSAGEMLVKL